jgi:hypothetical protein
MASILNNNIIRTKITCISWSDNAVSHLPPATPPVWSELKCLKRLHMYGAKHTEQALSAILLANNMLQEVTLRHFAIGNSNTVAALCSRSTSLLNLSLFMVECRPNLLVAVGNCCCNLRHLSIYILGTAAAKAWVTEAGLLAVAAGCRKLQQLTLSNIPAVSEAVLLAVAAHCPAVEWLCSAGYGTLTDAVLLALAVGCSKLRQLTCHAWAVTSVDAVDAAQSLLSRLETCPIDCTSDASPTAVARAAVLLRKATHLSLRYLSVEHIAKLCDSSLGPREGIPLTSKLDETVAVNELILKVASNSPRLKFFSFSGDCTVLESTLLTLAALYPSIISAVAQSVPGGVTEATLITLLSSWPQLTALGINHNVSVTDTVLHAVTQYCPHLYRLNLSANTIVSEEAVLELVRIPNFYMLTVPTSFSLEARQRVRNAASAAREADKR